MPFESQAGIKVTQIIKYIGLCKKMNRDKKLQLYFIDYLLVHLSDNRFRYRRNLSLLKF